MARIMLSKVSLSFGDRAILEDANLVLETGTKAALAGANGSGKSTLMKVIAGKINVDSGEISKEKGSRVAYLPQTDIVFGDNTLYKETESAFSDAISITKEIENLITTMEGTKDDEQLLLLSQKLDSLQLALGATNWHIRSALIEEVLQGLGFMKEDFDKKASTFSGGWQMRIALAKILLSSADILILDEPTNYLDLEAREFLKDFLIRFRGGFLIVSHDRHFLDSVAKETYEIFNAKLKKYVGTYTDYERQRDIETEYIVKKWKEQQEEIEKTEEFIRRFRSNARRAPLVQDRIKRLEKMELIQIPEHLKKIHFSFLPAPHSGKIVLNAKNISKSYEKHCVIKDFNMIIERGDKICLVGRNGAGKTTLLRVLAGVDSNFSGDLVVGEGVKIGYFSEEASREIVEDKTIITYIEELAPNHLMPKIKSMLAAFLFRGDDIYKSISVLSGGERSRLALLTLLLRPLNLLILDEPTNHLDIHSKDVLLEALQKFSGTVLFVSHDKYFIEHLAEGIIELRNDNSKKEGILREPSKIRYFPGNYDYYLYRCQKEEENKDIEEKEHKKALDSALSYNDLKKLKVENAKKKKQEMILIESIEEIEKEIKEKENELGKKEVYTNGEMTKSIKEEIAKLKEKIESLNEEWLSLMDS